MQHTKRVLPIVQRELLVASRKPTLPLMRVAAGTTAFVAVLAAVGFQGTPGTTSGARIFHTLTWIAYWSCFFGGTLLTSDCLAVERRNDTLGLLFLTDLKGYDVVFGKLAAKSLTGIFCLVAVVPMLAITFLLGGVTAGEFWRSVLVLLNTLLFSLSVGMVVSVFSKAPRGVIALGLLIMVLLAGMPMLAVTSFIRGGSGDRLFAALYPPAVLMLCPPNTFAIEAEQYFTNVAFTFLGSVLLLGIASMWIPRSWHTQPPKGARLGWINLKRLITQGGAEYRARMRLRLLNINPVLWLHSRDRSLRISLIIFFVVLAGGCYAMNFSRWFHWSNLSSAIACFVFLNIVFLALVAFESACYLIERRRDGALELILSTELTTEDILRGHWLAARRLFGGAFAVMILYALGWLFAASYHAVSTNRFFTALFPFLMTGSLLVSTHALVWCSMSYSLRAKWPSVPAARGFVTIVLMPLTWFAVPVLFANDSRTFFWVFFVTITIINAIVARTLAQTRLREEFRRMLTEPDAGKSSLGEGTAVISAAA